MCPSLVEWTGESNYDNYGTSKRAWFYKIELRLLFLKSNLLRAFHNYEALILKCIIWLLQPENPTYIMWLDVLFECLIYS